MNVRKVKIFLVIVILNLLVLHPNFYEIIPSKILTQNPASALFITAQEKDMRPRIFTFLSGTALDQKLRTAHRDEFTQKDVIEFQRDLLEPNVGLLYGVDTIDGYDNLMPRRISRILAVLGSERATVGDSLAYNTLPLNEKIQLFGERLPLLSMLNVKYIISAFNLSDISELELVIKINSTRFEIPIYIYKNTTIQPRAHFASSVQIIPPSEEDSFEKVMTDNRVTYIECTSCQESGRSVSGDSVKIIEIIDGKIIMNTTNTNPRWLVISQVAIPGWYAEIDGHRTEILIANHALQGLYIPTGQHSVILTYEGIQ